MHGLLIPAIAKVNHWATAVFTGKAASVCLASKNLAPPHKADHFSSRTRVLHQLLRDPRELIGFVDEVALQSEPEGDVSKSTFFWRVRQVVRNGLKDNGAAFHGDVVVRQVQFQKCNKALLDPVCQRVSTSSANLVFCKA